MSMSRTCLPAPLSRGSALIKTETGGGDPCLSCGVLSLGRLVRGMEPDRTPAAQPLKWGAADPLWNVLEYSRCSKDVEGSSHWR